MKSMSIKMLVLFALGTAVLPAVTIGFNCLTNNTSTCSTTVAPHFNVAITDAGDDKVLFTFSNTLNGPGRISRVFLDEGDIDPFVSFVVQPPNPGTNFVITAGGTLPGGNTAPHSFSTDHGANRSGSAANGVDSGETLKLLASLNNGFTYSGLVSSLAASPVQTSGVRLGLHVISLSGGRSEGLISDGFVPNSPVPEPGALALVVFGLAFVLAKLNTRPSGENRKSRCRQRTTAVTCTTHRSHPERDR